MMPFSESHNRLRSLFLSQWKFNPYQKLLVRHLRALGVEIAERSTRKAFLGPALFRYKPDILHLQNILPLTRKKNGLLVVLDLLLFLFQLIFLRAVGVKIVWTAHDLRSHEGKNAGLERVATILIGRMAHAIIAHCEKARAELLKQPLIGREDKVLVVPHGHYIGYYDNNISRARARMVLGLPEDSFTFLLLGWIGAYKGIVELIDAFGRMRSDKAYLVVAGNSPDPKFTDMIQQKVAWQDQIKFIPGFIPENEIQVYMNACDVVVLPYRDILTSGVVLLAMSFSRPCVAVRRGCIDEVLNDSGAFLYEPHSEEGLLRAMECAIDRRDELAGMGRYNQERAHQWGWDQVAQRTLAVYRRVLGDKSVAAFSTEERK